MVAPAPGTRPKRKRCPFCQELVDEQDYTAHVEAEAKAMQRLLGPLAQQLSGQTAPPTPPAQTPPTAQPTPQPQGPDPQVAEQLVNLALQGQQAMQALMRGVADAVDNVSQGVNLAPDQEQDVINRVANQTMRMIESDVVDEAKQAVSSGTDPQQAVRTAINQALQRNRRRVEQIADREVQQAQPPVQPTRPQPQPQPAQPATPAPDPQQVQEKIEIEFERMVRPMVEQANPQLPGAEVTRIVNQIRTQRQDTIRQQVTTQVQQGTPLQQAVQQTLTGMQAQLQQDVTQQAGGQQPTPNNPAAPPPAPPSGGSMLDKFGRGVMKGATAFIWKPRDEQQGGGHGH